MNLSFLLFFPDGRSVIQKKIGKFLAGGLDSWQEKKRKNNVFFFRSSPQLYTTEYLFLSVRPTRDWS
jgi:hypothetical protein